jgi:DNA invertase Pin-like site-specific DNA recombinase
MFELATNAPLVPTRTTPPRCAIYARSATAEYEKVIGQERACEAWLNDHLGADVAASARKYIDLGYSGLDLDRPSLLQLLADVEAGMLDVVVICDIARIARSTAGRDFVLECLGRSQTVLISLHEGVILAAALDAAETDDA